MSRNIPPYRSDYDDEQQSANNLWSIAYAILFACVAGLGLFVLWVWLFARQQGII